jgi:hypothetical protein
MHFLQVQLVRDATLLARRKISVGLVVDRIDRANLQAEEVGSMAMIIQHDTDFMADTHAQIMNSVSSLEWITLSVGILDTVA